MSKAKKENVADIIARQKKEQKTKGKPAKKKKTGVSATKKTNKPKRIEPNNKKNQNKLNSDITHLRKADIYLDFIEFIASPTHLKKYESQREFAKENKLHAGTLVDWKKKDGFWDDVRNARKTAIKENLLSSALSALHRKAIREGDSKEIKLLFQLADEFVEKSEAKSTVQVTELSAKKKEQIKKRISNWDEALSDEEDDSPEE